MVRLMSHSLQKVRLICYRLKMAILTFAVQLLTFLIILHSPNALWAQVDDPRSRFEDYQEHQKIQRDFEEQRISGLSDYLNEKKKVQDEFEKERQVFLAGEKRKINLPELSPSYDDYLLEKYAYGQWREKEKIVYRDELIKIKNIKKGKNALSEEIEYGLTDLEKNRIDFNKRKFVKGSGSGSSGGSSGGRFSGGTDFSAPRNDLENNEDMMPPPPAPEFDDADTIPPPPPPDEDSEDF